MIQVIGVTNERWVIRFSAPILRPGINIETEVSGKYLVSTVLKGMEFVREINNAENLKQNSE
jgi:hypothetical protein